MIVTKKEIIARFYYILSSKTGGKFESSDLPAILACTLTIEVFERWMDDQSNQEIESPDKRVAFQTWLEECELQDIWNPKSSEMLQDSAEFKRNRTGQYH